MKLNFDNVWVARIFSLILAIGLFTFVNLENATRFQSNEPNDAASIDGSEIITNLPIEVNIDTDRYFVSGIPDSASLRLQGPQALIFQTVATQGYTITTPNLNEAGEGSHTIELQVEGLSDNIMSSISPAVINLTIEEKVVEEYPVSIVIDENIDLATGYEILDPILATDTVQLSGAASTMEQIDQVVIQISSPEERITTDILLSAQVLVLDAEGKPLNVNANPSQIEINAPVVRTQKEVPLVLREGNGKLSSYDYEVTLSNSETDSIIVRGDTEAITALENFPVVIDFTGLTESTLVTVPIVEYPEGITEVSRDEIEVLIEITKKDQNSRSTN